MAATERHILSQERKRFKEGVYWSLYIYYPSDGKVVHVMVPERKESVILNDAIPRTE